MKNKKYDNIAYLFLLPWLIGLVLFIIYPLFHTIFLSFNSVVKNIDGWKTSWIGSSNFRMAFFENTEFTPLLIDFITMETMYVPTVIILSFILAMLLNTKIKGRSFFRTIYFFPAIILSGPVLTQLISTNTTQLIDLNRLEIFTLLDSFSPVISNGIISLFEDVTVILWFTGIPIVLFMNGLQKIDGQIYEAAQIDGANGWQIFWKITVPHMRSTALIVGIFTVVQVAILEINPLYNFIVATISQNYANGLGFAAAIVLVFSVVVLLFILIVFIVFRDYSKEEKVETIAKWRERQEALKNKPKKFNKWIKLFKNKDKVGDVND